MIFLDLEALLYVAERTLGTVPSVRDYGLLESALARPQATAFGDDAYTGIHEKAAALLQSLACNHALIDGNKRLALAGILSFYGMNGLRLTLTNDEAYRLVMSVASSELVDVGDIASVLERGTARHPEGYIAGPSEEPERADTPVGQAPQPGELRRCQRCTAPQRVRLGWRQPDSGRGLGDLSRAVDVGRR